MQENVFIKNKTGKKLAAIVHKPAPGNQFPAVILLHGFTGYKKELHIVSLAEELEKSDVIAIRFDCSGFGESEGAIEEDFKFTNYLSDIDYIYDYLKSLEYVDTSRIGIFGHSMGAMLTIIWASKHPEIKALCTVSPSTQMIYKDMPQDLSNFLQTWEEKGWFEKRKSGSGVIRIPYSFVKDIQQYNVLDYIELIEQPILIILGKSDKTVIPQNTERIFDRANEPKWLLEVDGMEHDYKNQPGKLELVNKEARNFFVKHLS